MRIALPLFLCLLFAFAAIAQQTAPVNNLLLGYQEFPTVVTSHTADSDGNQYYTGYFRGQLTVKNKVLASGNGLEDIFWVKTTPDGQVIRHKIFGTPNSEVANADAMAMGANNHMLFAFRCIEPLTIGSFTVLPYAGPVGPAPAAALVYADTTGDVKWVKRTNLQNFRINYSDKIFHVFAGVYPGQPAVKVNDQTVIDSIGLMGIVHLMFDETGKLLNAKTIKVRKQGQGITLLNTGFFSDKSLLLQVRVDADTAFFIHNHVELLPPSFSNYHLLIKTDTAYTNIRARLLNPQFQMIGGLTNSMLPVHVAGNDSIYSIINYEPTNNTLFLDGFALPRQQNNLCVFDNTLTLRRTVALGASITSPYTGNIYKRRIYFRHLFYQNGQLYLNGQFTGVNESPMNAIAKRDTTIRVLPGVSTTLDLNGPSQSFMAKFDLSLANAKLTWYGDHREYENMMVTPAFLHRAGNNRLAFVQGSDNVWNPWTINADLTVATGAMRKGADMPEVPHFIQYFNDGSRLILGYARGRTAFDPAGNAGITNGARRDVFLVRLRANNQVAWYKRLHSTLTSADIRGLQLRNNKAWFLVSYVGTQNDSNFIRVDTSVYDVGVNASLMASVDTAGNITTLNLTNGLLRYTMLRHFQFFSNGDLCVATAATSIPKAVFPGSTSLGIFLFRLNAQTGETISSRKIYSSSALPGVNNLAIDNNDQLYISGQAGFSASPYTLFLHDGTKVADMLQVNSSTTSFLLSLLKLDWNDLRWQKRVSGNGYAFTGRQIGELQLFNGKPLLGLTTVPNHSIYWDGKLIHSGASTMVYSLAELDAEGNLVRSKSFPNFNINYAKPAPDNKLYISGMISRPVQIDTIRVNHAGIADGLSLVLDSNLVAKRSFRVASAFAETMLDMDIYRDTLIGLAYTAQTNPQVYFNRGMVEASDFEEDAYLGTINTKNNIVTSINNPLPPLTHVSITPNPIEKRAVQLSVQVTEPLRSTCTVYSAGGQQLTTAIVPFTPGTNRYQFALPSTAGTGVYHVVISNRRWTVTRTFIVL